ncbi:MAG: amino acid adenylation domain-containing protein, partial [Acidobacteria bacterium]|nr:amino acid adenylation domain-containing protein [Acidobacteriota bacterium]
GLLGILKAGGAYVPLDPVYPQERLAFMLEDTRSPVLLTQSKLVESVPQSEAQVVCIEREWSEIAGEGRENPSSEATAENVAYVIYTSGSTGKPKGAMILHRGMVNYLSWCTKSYAVADGGGAPVHSPLGFDLTVTSLFSPLLVGQRVVLVLEETGVEAVEALGAALRHEGPFSLVKLTPSHLELLSQSLPTTEDAGRTRALIIGGEALTGESLVFWQEHAPETRLINEYGPTETVVGCCVYELAGGQRLAGAVPIGRPIANTHLYVLDAYLNPVPVGVTGELYVGGDGLARGYLNRPELTAERFIADPFATGPGARLYRTGDLARYLPDGNLEFLGRLDNQVKVRGYRIELGEIEVVLNQHPTVRETVVVVRGEGGSDKRLVAYLVACEGSAALNTSELRSYLRGRLPEYMVPQSFALLNEMPLTSNGKVDRRALPEHDGGRPAMDAEYVGPRTGVEEEMARIWVEVLGVKQVGVYDNFFELGGHSLLATRVVSRVRKNMEVELPLRAIFEEPTVAGLAVAVTERRGGRQDSPIVKMERANRGNAGQLLEMLDQLSDEEVNSLLGDVLAGKEIRG